MNCFGSKFSIRFIQINLEEITMSIQFVSPNLWTLHGGGISIRYSTIPIVGPAGAPHLFYQDSRNPSNNRTFTANEIRTVNVPDLSEVASVTLHTTVDAGSTTLGIPLPVVNIVLQGSVSSSPVTTEAITTTHSGPLSPPSSATARKNFTLSYN
jgi:hypothetical protein